MDLPRMNDYLASLPAGLDSYPDYQQKASVYRQFVDEVGGDKLLGRLPAPIERMLTHPLPVSEWVTETHATALNLAIADVYFPDERDFLSHKLAANRKMLSGPLYKLLLAVVSPLMLLKRSDARWQAFHRGITLATKQTGPKRAEARMGFPAHLVPELLVKTYGTVFEAICEAAGGKDVVVAVHGRTEHQATYEISWR